MKKENEGKAVIAGVLVIMLLTFLLGWMCSTKKEEKTIFTREELETILQLQTMEDEKNSGAQVYAYKDKNGNLLIGYDYSDIKRR